MSRYDATRALPDPPFIRLSFLNVLCLLLFQIKRLIGNEKETLSILERFVAGSLAGVMAQSAIYPMEVILCLCSSAGGEPAIKKLC